MTERCAAPVSLATLIAYWLGELDEDAEQKVEAHYFGCADCAGALAELAALGDAIRASFAGGTLHAVVSAAFVERMKQRGMRLREYRVAPGGSVNCTITPDDDAVISRLKVPLLGVSRLDLLRLDQSGAVRMRLDDVPFDRAAGEVLFCPAASELRPLLEGREIMRLVAVDDAGERVLGDYIFDHTAS
jgi:hypothetical protein